MLRSMLALALLVAAIPADAGIIDPAKITAIKIPDEARVPAVGRPRVRKVKVSAEAERTVSRSVSGSGSLHGTAYLPCPSDGDGLRFGMVPVSGSIEVSNSDGARGTAFVSGLISVSGTCHGGGGSVSGSGVVSGSASIYDRNGRFLGSAHVSDHVSLNGFGSGAISFSETVNPSGSF